LDALDRGDEPDRTVLRDAVRALERISEVTTAELAYIVEIERDRVKVGDDDANASSSLRVTSIFRREDGEWRLVHRHADPITAPRPIESVLER
jgi:ketosteroid isomerase-like protein